MKNTSELAYSYRAVCSILEARGFSLDQTAAFLKREQTPNGYILASKLPVA